MSITASETKKQNESFSAQTISSEKHSSKGQHIDTVIELISLNDVPLEERRKQAREPLYLVRYE